MIKPRRGDFEVGAGTIHEVVAASSAICGNGIDTRLND